MKRRRLGQHYLVSKDAIERTVGAAFIHPGERVLEIGAGKGALTSRLAKVADEFEAYEIDKENFEATRSLVGPGAKLTLGNAFRARPDFDVLVSSLPYSESSNFIEWLSMRKYDRAIVVLQKDFATKIIAEAGTRGYRAVSVLAQLSARISLLDKFNRDAFDPPPRVASRLVGFEHRRSLVKREIVIVKKIFALRRRTLGGVLQTLGLKAVGTSDASRRVYSLTPAEVYGIIRTVRRK